MLRNAQKKIKERKREGRGKRSKPIFCIGRCSKLQKKKKEEDLKNQKTV